MADTPLEIRLKQELQRWALANLRPIGVPTGFEMPGINVDIFHLDARLSSLQKLLVEKEILDEDEMLVAFQEHLLERLTSIREKHEKEEAQKMLVAKTTLLDPDGKPFH